MKRLVLNVAGLFVAIVAVLFGLPSLYLMAAILWLIPAVSYLMGWLMLGGLTCERILPLSATAGETVPDFVSAGQQQPPAQVLPAGAGQTAARGGVCARAASGSEPLAGRRRGHAGTAGSAAARRFCPRPGAGIFHRSAGAANILAEVAVGLRTGCLPGPGSSARLVAARRGLAGLARPVQRPDARRGGRLLRGARVSAGRRAAPGTLAHDGPDGRSGCHRVRAGGHAGSHGRPGLVPERVCRDRRRRGQCAGTGSDPGGDAAG